MSFLSAAFLFALPLAALPVAIHLYRGRQRDVVPWGAMQFLSVAATKGRTMERLEELALMAIRLAAVVALVLALARPMMQSRWLGRGGDGEVILILDNSLSMSREADGQSAAEQLRRRAVEVIDGLSSGQSVQVLLACGAEWATTDAIAGDAAGKRQLHRIINEATPTLGTAQLRDCIQAAVHLEAPEALSHRRIVVLCDNQDASWQAEPKSAWRQLAQARDALPFPVAIDVVDCGLALAEFDNLAVMKLDAVQKLLRPEDSLDLSAEIMNVGNAPSRDTSVEWIIDGKVVQTAPLPALKPRGLSSVSTSLRMEKPGIFRISCRIAAVDQLPLDQEDSVVVEVADQTPILVVQNAAADPASVSTAELIIAALGYSGGAPQRWHSVFRPETVAPDALADRQLTDVRAVIIDNLSQLDDDVIERLEAFVRGGGGLWVGVGDGIDRERFNGMWYRDGAGLSPVALGAVENLDDPDAPAATIHPPSRAHPATAQLANTTQLDVDEARIDQRWKFATRPASAEPVSALLECGDGEPLLVEHFVGRGRVLVQAGPLGLQWSNFPLLKSYVVMLHDGLDYITSPTSSRFNLAPGSPIVAAALGEPSDASALVITPRGRKLSLKPTASDSASTYRYSQTRLPGAYLLRISRDGKPVRELPFYVERNSAESELQPLIENQRNDLMAAGVRFDAGPAALRGVAATAPRREPIWGALLTALVALLAVELLVASRLARQRHGYVPATT